MPDCLSREPTTVLHLASIAPEVTHRRFRWNLGYRMRSAILSKLAAPVRICSIASGLGETVDRSAIANSSILPGSSGRRRWVFIQAFWCDSSLEYSLRANLGGQGEVELRSGMIPNTISG
jgi:hypothetical protein